MRRAYGGFGMLQQQRTKLHMTPQLQQAVKILQMPAPELRAFINQQLEDNPMLEQADWSTDTRKSTGSSRSSSDYDSLQHVAGQTETLEQHLLEQLNVDLDEKEEMKRIVRYLIGNLDASGYLSLDDQQLAVQLEVDQALVAQAFQILRKLEPAGVGARSLSECLKLQAERLPECHPLLMQLIEDFLEDVAASRIHKLKQRLKASEADITTAIAQLKSLQPRPGAAFQAGAPGYVLPDVIVRSAGEEGQFAVMLHDAAFPRLHINAEYEKLTLNVNRTEETGIFLHTRRSAAAFLIRCLEQRRATLLRVTRAIVEEQAAFFRFGPAQLRPMTLLDIADKLGLHESTISRAASGKFALTAWGTYELGFFFPTGFNKGLDDAISAESVKARLKELIRTEGESPYSDQQLADAFAQDGIPISRRTVTKYRESLGIASSIHRKR
ncbi:RNA polymerase factor sigma-54 [Paenibacillus sp. OV219]|uniref:RNA polymerase factor sigma-54 n=1 Tax=Paenibacillus sp. OV219 TaxID=1884377 RepID=UPI0015A69834|nr:RNA polymerase factor sigma-54 [Paenibacillus sp. OV219]